MQLFPSTATVVMGLRTTTPCRRSARVRTACRAIERSGDLVKRELKVDADCGQTDQTVIEMSAVLPHIRWT